MKQRTRVMHSGDDLNGYDMANYKKNDDDGSNEIQLHKIHADGHFIEAQVQQGDTLQAIALRFYCSISELKRINHIDKDNEIFARRIIKVPVTPYSVLTELLPSQPSPGASTSTSVLPNATKPATVDNNNEPKQKSDFSIDCNEIVLNSSLAPAVIPYTDVDTNDTISEDTELIPKKEKLSVEAVVVKELTSHGADFDLKWFHLIGCLIVLGVIVPIVYVMFFIENKHEHPDISPLKSP